METMSKHFWCRTVFFFELVACRQLELSSEPAWNAKSRSQESIDQNCREFDVCHRLGFILALYRSRQATNFIWSLWFLKSNMDSHCMAMHMAGDQQRWFRPKNQLTVGDYSGRLGGFRSLHTINWTSLYKQIKNNHSLPRQWQFKRDTSWNLFVLNPT